jgi:hypothetical protein
LGSATTNACANFFFHAAGVTGLSAGNNVCDGPGGGVYILAREAHCDPPFPSRSLPHTSRVEAYRNQ